MTKELLTTTPENHKHTLETYSNLIADAEKRGRADMSNEYTQRLRGYLACMKDSGTITESGRKVLFLWYGSTRVEQLNRK